MPIAIHRGQQHLRPRRRSLLPDVVRPIALRAAIVLAIFTLLALANVIHHILRIGNVPLAQYLVAARGAGIATAIFATLLGLSLLAATVYEHRHWGWLFVLGTLAAGCVYAPSFLIGRAVASVTRADYLDISKDKVTAGLVSQFLGAYKGADALGEVSPEMSGAIERRLQSLKFVANSRNTTVRDRLLASIDLASRFVPIFATLGSVLFCLVGLAAVVDLATLSVGLHRGHRNHGLGFSPCWILGSCRETDYQACGIWPHRKKCWKAAGGLCPCKDAALVEEIEGWRIGGPKMCHDCPTYISHQRDKFRMFAPIVLIGSVAAVVIFRGQLQAAAHRALVALVPALGAASGVAPSLGAASVSGLEWVATGILLVFVVLSLLRAFEFAIFGLKV